MKRAALRPRRAGRGAGGGMFLALGGIAIAALVLGGETRANAAEALEGDGDQDVDQDLHFLDDQEEQVQAQAEAEPETEIASPAVEADLETSEEETDEHLSDDRELPAVAALGEPRLVPTLVGLFDDDPHEETAKAQMRATAPEAQVIETEGSEAQKVG